MLLLLQINASSAALWRADQFSLDTGLQAGVWTKSAPGARCVGRGEARSEVTMGLGPADGALNTLQSQRSALPADKICRQRVGLRF